MDVRSTLRKASTPCLEFGLIGQKLPWDRGRHGCRAQIARQQCLQAAQLALQALVRWVATSLLRYRSDICCCHGSQVRGPAPRTWGHVFLHRAIAIASAGSVLAADEIVVQVGSTRQPAVAQERLQVGR
jgi:hypothetical protein